MSRISRYQESIKRFIENRSSFINIKGSEYENSIKENIGKDNYILSILFLTIMNKQTKKNHTSYQGYYAASGIEFMRIFMKYHMRNDAQNLNNLLIMLCMKSWNQNIETIKKHISKDKIIKLYSQFINIFSEKFGVDKVLYPVNKTKKEKTTSDLHRYFFEGKSNELKEKFLKIKQYEVDILNSILENKVCSLCEFVVIIAWIFGGGNDSNYSRLIKAGRSFGIVYQLSKDFENIERDLKNSENNETLNYVINCGIQNSYETFLHNKQQFIEESMNLDIFSSTVKEIIDMLEQNVNNVIDKTTPDLKSSYSTLN